MWRKVRNKLEQGSAPTGMYAVGMIVLVAFLMVAMPLFTSFSVASAKSTLEDNGYVIFSIGEYSTINTKLDVIEQEVYEAEKHMHNRERWFGKLGVQTATDWGDEASIAPYQAISGLGIFGADGNDEALVLGTDDTPAISGMTKFDAHRILITASNTATDWVLRLIYGTGTMADAETAGQYTDMMIQEARKGSPVEVLMPRAGCGSSKLWLRAKNASDDATVDFFVGIHEYIR